MATPKAAWGMEIGANAIKAIRLERDGHTATVSDFAVIPHKKVLTTPDLEAFFADYAYAVAPPTDDHPFFFHFFKWQQTPEILQTLGKTWQPFGGSGYLVLVVLLILAVILSTGLIVLPLLMAKLGRGAGEQESKGKEAPLHLRAPTPLLVRYLLYFALLGLGFLFIEIPLLQRFILYLGQPAYAFAIVVSALLVAAGVGPA